MKNKPRVYLLISLLLIVSMVGTACTPHKVVGDSAGGNDKVVIDFWSFWGSETRRPVIEKIIEVFNNSQDRITVKHTYLPWGDIWTKNLAAIAAKNPADVIINDIASVHQRASKGQNTDLSNYLAKENIEDRFYPQLWDNVLYNDKAYAIPFNTDTRMLYYNKKAFKEAGLDPNKPPQTWEELEEYAKKLDKKNGNTYEQIGFYPLWGDFGKDNWLFNGDGGQGFFDENEQPTINTPGKVETLKWLQSWNDRLGQKTIDAMSAEFGSQQSDPFISGKVAMLLQQGTFATQIRDYGKDMEVGIAPIPEKTEGSGHYSGGGGFVVEIPKGAKHPDEAWEFIKYLTGTDAQKYWAEKNYDNVANIEAATDSKISEDPFYKASVDNLEVTKQFRAPLNAPDFKNLIDPQLDAAMLKKISPEKALEKAEADVKNQLKSHQ